MLNHDILIEKLSRYGIRGIANDWFHNYLSKRKQFVNYNNVLSSRSKITTGVPQGSILGPLLFLLYINDISYSSEILKFILYADDTNIFHSWESIDELCDVVNTELQGVMQWFKANRLSVNLKKTNFVIFGNSVKLKKIKKFEIILDKTKISRTETAKFLGVVIDENLSWKHHINYIKGKIAKSVGILKRLKYRLPENTLNTLYNTLILPYLNYCNIIWVNNKPTRLQPLLMLQKCSMQIISHSSYNTHALPLFSQLNQLTVELDDGSKFECVDKFCYLGDMLSAGGGAEEAAKTRVRSAWGKFNELAPILTKRGASMKLKGRIYDACVQRVLVYGSETWG